MRHYKREILVFLLYMLVIFIYTFQGFEHFANNVIGVPGDSIAMIWQIHWEYYAIFHHMNLFYSPKVLLPFGANMAWCAPMLPGLLGIPFEMFTNLIITYNSLLMLSWVLSAYISYRMTLIISKRVIASFFSGLVFATSTYFVGHALGHLTLIMAFGIPLFALFLYKGYLRWSSMDSGNHISWRSIFGLSISLFLATESAYDYGIYSIELGLVLLMGLGFESSYRFLRGKLFYKEFILSGLIFAILVSPSIYNLLFTQTSVGINTAASSFDTPYVSDLLTFVTPSPLSFLFKGQYPHFSGNAAEYSCFLGIIPILAIIYVLMKCYRKDKNIRVWVLITSIFLVLSLGPELHINGHLTNVQLPGLIMQKIPIINITLPVRFNLLIMLGVGVLTGIAIDNFYTNVMGNKQMIYKLGYLFAMAFLILAPNAPILFPSTKPEYSHPFNLSGTVLDLPFIVPSTNFYQGDTGYLYGQALSDFSYSIPEGYLSRLPVNVGTYINENPIYQFLGGIYTNPTNISGIEKTKLLIPYYERLMNLTYVVVRDDQINNFHAYLVDVEKLFGSDITQSGNITIFKIHPSGYNKEPKQFAAASPIMQLILEQGWSSAEGTGDDSWIWSNGNKSMLLVPNLSEYTTHVRIRLAPFLYPGHKSEQFTIKLNGHVYDTVRIVGDQWIKVNIPFKSTMNMPNQIDFEYQSTAKPSVVLHNGDDNRQIAICIKEIEIW